MTYRDDEKIILHRRARPDIKSDLFLLGRLVEFASRSGDLGDEFVEFNRFPRCGKELPGAKEALSSFFFSCG
jgi:hypothetical protein